MDFGKNLQKLLKNFRPKFQMPQTLGEIARDWETFFHFELCVIINNDYFVCLCTLFQFCFFLIISNGC